MDLLAKVFALEVREATLSGREISTYWVISENMVCGVVWGHT